MGMCSEILSRETAIRNQSELLVYTEVHEYIISPYNMSWMNIIIQCMDTHSIGMII